MTITQLCGIDFSSSPTRKKPIVIAHGSLGKISGREAVCIERISTYTSLTDFDAWLAAPGAWVGGFDLPFALPREFLAASLWPHQSWAEHMAHVQTLTRAQMVIAFKAFCNARPAGGKFAHRACDTPAGSSPSMKWVNPPVAYMLHAGATRLFNADICIPKLRESPSKKIALEAYPGFFARSIAGRASYKSDDIHKQDMARQSQREAILAAIEDGRNPLSLNVVFNKAIREEALLDGSGDVLDACICLLQAAWAAQRKKQNYGLPPQTDTLEGWIVTVPWPQ